MGMALGILKTTYFLHISEAQYLDKTDSMFINVGEQNMNVRPVSPSSSETVGP